MSTGNSAIMGGTIYESSGGALTPRSMTPKELASMLDKSTLEDNSIPYGYCHCGCGQKTRVAIKTSRSRGEVKDEPLAFLRGHRQRGIFDGSRLPYWSDIDQCFRLPLAQGTFSLIDECDIHVTNGSRWSEIEARPGLVYAKSMIQGRNVFLHRLIMTPANGMVVDHINHDGLDNRRQNLRIVTNLENLWNRKGPNSSGSSGFIGVTFDKGNHTNPWLARIRNRGVTEHLGSFPTKIEAALAYDERAMQIRGEMATLNFSGTGPTRTAAIADACKWALEEQGNQ